MPALQTVHVRVTDAETGMPTPCRIRFEGPGGTAFAPFGRVADAKRIQRLSEFGGNVSCPDSADSHAVIDGSCEINLPPGPITVSIAKGFEYRPLRETVVLAQGQLALRFVIQRVADLRSEGWFSGEIACYDLSPHDALLEGAAEDLAVVNLLVHEHFSDPAEAASWAPKYRNITAFSGQRPCVSRPGHEVVVNTCNGHCPLGTLVLLNCHRIVFPLSANLSDGSGWTLADWCDQCHRKGGLVVGSFGYIVEEHRQSESLADVLLGKVDAATIDFQYSYEHLPFYMPLLQAGVRLPLVAASWKRSDRGFLGSPRTYARLPPFEPYSYRGWIEAVRAGRVFVTSGPLLSVTVNDKDPGAVIDLPVPGSVRVAVSLRGIRPIERIEVMANGEVVATATAAPGKTELATEFDIDVPTGGWVLARAVIETYEEVQVLAMSSPVWVTIGGRHRPRDPAAVALLDDHLRQTLAWLDEPNAVPHEKLRERLKEMMRAARDILRQ